MLLRGHFFRNILYYISSFGFTDLLLDIEKISCIERFHCKIPNLKLIPINCPYFCLCSLIIEIVNCKHSIKNLLQ